MTSFIEFKGDVFMAPHIYCGRGDQLSHADLMDLINLCFNAQTPESALDGLLPKCYREHYRPQDQNYIITEDGTPVAAVGAYDHAINVCDRHIACRGIGNVAVHPDHRSKGYMKMAMNKALTDMVSDGIALSTLAGHRQRYQYFGYEKSGAQYCFNISPQNIHHLFKDTSCPYALKRITDPEDALIDEIIRITDKKPYFPVRPREKYLDIANTWKADLFVLTDISDGNFIGYCIINKAGTITEIGAKSDEYLLGMLHSVFTYLNKSFVVNIPSYDIGSLSILVPIAEDHSLGVAMMYNVFDYKTVIDAFMALKLSYTALPEGELTLLIHGFAKDERLRITVKDGKHTLMSVCDAVDFDLELEHLQAIELLFGPISAFRERQNALIRCWFPLPLWMYSADEV
jgi:GNAT superfamily N-acetyltransferase